MSSRSVLQVRIARASMPSEVLGSCGRAPNFTAALQHPKPAYGSLPADTAVPHIAPCPDTSRCPPSGAKRTVFVYNGGKEDAAFGNLFYATATNAVLYASHKRYVPLMRLQRELVWRTMGSVWAKRNTTLWQEFFQVRWPNRHGEGRVPRQPFSLTRAPTLPAALLRQRVELDGGMPRDGAAHAAAPRLLVDDGWHLLAGLARRAHPFWVDTCQVPGRRAPVPLERAPVVQRRLARAARLRGAQPGSGQGGRGRQLHLLAVQRDLLPKMEARRTRGRLALSVSSANPARSPS